MGTGDRSHSIGEYATDAVELDLDAFSEKHAASFLVRSIVDGELTPPDQLTAEEWLTPAPDVYSTKMASPRKTAEQGTAGSMFFVYPVRQRRTKSGSAIVVGRTPGCDICIGDASLSKVHAAFEWHPENGMMLTDRESKNGTFIGDERLQPGIAYQITFGKSLMFGRVRLTYMEAPQFIDFVRATARQPPTT